jgi:hypothetical protein
MTWGAVYRVEGEELTETGERHMLWKVVLP